MLWHCALQELSAQLRDANLDVIGSFTNTLFSDEDEMVAKLRLLPGVTDLQASFKDKVCERLLDI